MQVIKCGKRHLIEGMYLPNQDKIRTLGEKETYKNLSILEANTIKQVEMKNIKKEYLQELENYSKQNYRAETLSENKYLGCTPR